MDLLQRLWLELERERMICLAGSGGKTSLLHYLGRQCAIRGIPAALLTTTHIQPPQEALFPLVEEVPEAARAWAAGRVPVVGSRRADGRLGPPAPQLIQALHGQGALLLIEADGSRQLPIKFPNATEPVLPPQTTRVIVVAGLSALGRPLQEVCHRWELACRELGLSPVQPVTPQVMAALLLAGYGRYRPTILLNQTDTAQPEDWETLMGRLHQGGIRTVAAASLRQEAKECLF